MKNTSLRLSVLFNGLLVGTLEKQRGVLFFSYDSSWLALQGARPISLSLPLVEKPFSGDVVYNFFDNLLPDNVFIRSRLQARFKSPTDQPFDLLSNIGKECVGAIQLVQGDVLPIEREINSVPLTEKKIAALLRQVRVNPLGMSEQLEDFRISIAGAQEKSALLWWEGQWGIPVGVTPTTHIFKLPIGYIQHQHIDLTDSCENEWLCSKIVAAFGLPVAPCEIHQFEDIKALVVERFDRHLSSDGRWIMRLPQEDMCQALGISPHLKYQADGGPGVEAIMRLLLGSSHATHDRDVFLRAQIVFWLLAAIDGHAKNFSIFLEAGGRYRLTPLYDIMSAYPLIAQKQLQANKIKMAMALKGKNNHYHWQQAQRRHFSEMGHLVGYSGEKSTQLLDETLRQVDAVIEQVSGQLPETFPAKIAQAIFEGMLKAKERLSS